MRAAFPDHYELDITTVITFVMMFKNFAQLLHGSNGTLSMTASSRRNVYVSFRITSV